MSFNCLKATEPIYLQGQLTYKFTYKFTYNFIYLQFTYQFTHKASLRGDSLLFTTKSLGGPGTHLIDLTILNNFEPWTPDLGIQHLKEHLLF